MTTNRWLLAGIATCIALPAHAVDLEQQMDFNIRGCDGSGFRRTSACDMTANRRRARYC
jgi:hypothetical protein